MFVHSHYHSLDNPEYELHKFQRKFRFFISYLTAKYPLIRKHNQRENRAVQRNLVLDGPFVRSLS